MSSQSFVKTLPGLFCRIALTVVIAEAAQTHTAKSVNILQKTQKRGPRNTDNCDKMKREESRRQARIEAGEYQDGLSIRQDHIPFARAVS